MVLWNICYSYVEETKNVVLENEVTNQWAKFLVPKFEELTTFCCFLSFYVSLPLSFCSFINLCMYSSAIFI
jgi:hypothetical protein